MCAQIYSHVCYIQGGSFSISLRSYCLFMALVLYINVYKNTHIFSYAYNILSLYQCPFYISYFISIRHMLPYAFKNISYEKRRDELRLAIQLDNIDIVNPLLYKDHCIQISSLAQGGTYLFWFMVLILYIRAHKNTNILLCVQYIQIGLIYCFIYLYVYKHKYTPIHTIYLAMPFLYPLLYFNFN